MRVCAVTPCSSRGRGKIQRVTGPDKQASRHLNKKSSRTKPLARRTQPGRGAASGFVLADYPDMWPFRIEAIPAKWGVFGEFLPPPARHHSASASPQFESQFAAADYGNRLYQRASSGIGREESNRHVVASFRPKFAAATT
jgi:hypothetical protein